MYDGTSNTTTIGIYLLAYLVLENVSHENNLEFPSVHDLVYVYYHLLFVLYCFPFYFFNTITVFLVILIYIYILYIIIRYGI